MAIKRIRGKNVRHRNRVKPEHDSVLVKIPPEVDGRDWIMVPIKKDDSGIIDSTFRPKYLIPTGHDAVNAAYMQSGLFNDEIVRFSALAPQASWAGNASSPDSIAVTEHAANSPVDMKCFNSRVGCIKTEVMPVLRQNADVGRVDWSLFGDKLTPSSLSIPASTNSGSPLGGIRCEEMQRFRIDDSAAVVMYLKEKLYMLQQQVDKKMSKAWIKGICPKKQAHFPYRKKKGPNDDLNDGEMTIPGDIPAWWPPTDSCRYIEPDHIGKLERVALLLHILRLRPTPNQLRDWNHNQGEPNKTHQIRGWTDFIEELTPLSLFQDIVQEPEFKKARRADVVRDLFTVAKMEEDYLNDARDGADTFAWNREAALHEINRAEKEEQQNRSDSEYLSDHATVGKKRKRGSQKTTEPANGRITKRPAIKTHRDCAATVRDVAPLNRIQSLPTHGFAAPESTNQYSYTVGNMPSLASSFDAMQSNINHFTDPYVATHSSPNGICGPAPAPHHHMISAYSVTECPQPQFEAIPNYAMCPSYPMGLGPDISSAFFGPGNTAMTAWTERSGGYFDHVAQFPNAHDVAAGMHIAANMTTPVGEAAEYNNDACQLYQPNVPFRHAEHKPLTFFPPDALTGAMDRGFTGHASGTGGGAWT